MVFSGAKKPAGWEVRNLALYFYKKVTGRSGEHDHPTWDLYNWLRWMATAYDRGMFQRYAKQTSTGDRWRAAINGVCAQANNMIAAMEKNPENAKADETINYTPFWTSASGYGLVRGEHNIPVRASTWFMLTARLVNWAAREIGKGNISISYLDAILYHMVWQTEGQRIPVFSAPGNVTNQNNPVEWGAWKLFLKETGGSDAWDMYLEYSRQRHEDITQELAQLNRYLGNAEKILRYASLQEPLYRLREKINEFFSKQRIAKQGFQLYHQNREIAERIFTPEEKTSIESAELLLQQEEQALYSKLPSGMWQGDAPSGLGAAPIVWVAVSGAVAVCLIAVVSYSIQAIDSAIEQQNHYDLQNRIRDEVLAEKERLEQLTAASIMDVERALQEGRISQKQHDDMVAAKRTQLAEQRLEADRTAAAASAAAAEARANKPQAGSGGLSTGLLLGGLAALAGVMYIQK